MSKKQITIGSLTDHTETPSSRFRVRQLIGKLKNENIIVTDYPRKFSTQNASNFMPNKRVRESLLKIFYSIILQIANYWNRFVTLYFKVSKY